MKSKLHKEQPQSEPNPEPSCYAVTVLSVMHQPYLNKQQEEFKLKWMNFGQS